MQATITDTVNQFSLDGPVRLVAAVAIAMIMMALFAWALRRESGILGRRNAILFWILRSVAVVTTIWMLLAPVNVRVETSTTRKTIAVMTDVSASMQTIDPVGKGDDLRWAVAQNQSPQKIATQHTATQHADRAIAAIRIASLRISEAVESLKQRKPESQVVVQTNAADEAIAAVIAHVESVQAATDRMGKRSRANLIAAGLLDSLGDSDFDAFHRLCVALRKGRTPSQKGWREGLPDLAYRLATLTRTLNELARQVAREEASHVAKRQPELITATAQQPRLRRVAGVIDQLQTSTFEPASEEADVVFSSFDQSVSLLPDQENPSANVHSLVRKLADPADVAGNANVGGTSVSAALEELNRARQDQPIAAVFLMTDVAHNQIDSANPREVAATLQNTPVYVVPVGNPEHVRDIALQTVFAPSVAMRNDDIVIEAMIQAYDCEGEVCTVQLLQDGSVIDFREVLLDSSFAKRAVRFERRMPEIGVAKFQMAVVPLDGELTEENNFDEFDVNVTRSDIKILLADEHSRWEQRYLTHLFRRDDNIQCDELLYHPRMIATGRRAATGTLPVSAEEWNQYDVVLLGDLPPEHLPDVAQETLIQYMEKRGGTVVVIAGQESMPHAYQDRPLESVLPVQRIVNPTPAGADGYAFRITELGQNHDAMLIGQTADATKVAWDFVNQFSPLHSLSPWRQPKPSARTLISAVPRGAADEAAEMKSNAFLCWQPVGRGRIVYLSGPDSYRLRFLRGDALHHRFWGQLLRWAIAADLSVGTEFVRIRTEKSRYDSREPITATVLLVDQAGEPVADDNLQVRITSTDHEQSVPLVPDPEVPGKFKALIGELEPGVYRVEPIGDTIDALQAETALDRASTSFTVKEDLPLELVDTRSDRALAQQIASITGGQVIPPTAVTEIVNLTDLKPIVTEKIQRKPLWTQWKYLWLVFGCLQTEWVIRKLMGLS